MRVLWITAVVILADQLSKVAVLQTMARHESIPILGDWLKLTFTENPGMAFGISFGPRGMVTIFSIIATVLIVMYMYQVRKGYLPYVASLAFILGGAVGNIIDRVFYGVLLGYDGLFTGKVVDFIHVNVWRGYLPDALPFIGGSYLALFPIWNVADMAIVLGVVGILLFQKRFYQQHQAQVVPVPGAAAAGQVPAGATLSGAAPEGSFAGPPVQAAPPLPRASAPVQDEEVLDERQRNA